MQTYPTRLLEQAVAELSKLPGIGRKTALRMALHLLKRPAIEVEALGAALVSMRNEIRYCSRCLSISDDDICLICANSNRDQHQICVVEDIRDVMAIENTHQYNGLYHVLGGILSPIEGIGPQDLHISSLIDRIAPENIQEIILALPATIEGDTTNFYLFKKAGTYHIAVTTIARGVSVGDDLEHADEITLGRSIVNRTPYESMLQKK